MEKAPQMHAGSGARVACREAWVSLIDDKV